MEKHKLSVVVPVYYNRETLETLYSRIMAVAVKNPSMEIEVVFVDDDSGDDSYQILRKIALANNNITTLKLSRNFGSFTACLAGLTRCTGDCVVIISADLQDPPELIDTMYKKWLEGNKVVMAVRERREEGFLKVFFARMYYQVFRIMVTKNMPKGGFDFVLIDRKVVNVLTHIQEKNTTLMGLILWTGFQRAEIPYTRMERLHGKSRWSLVKKVNYFLDSIMAFSKFPIRVFSLIGLFLFALSLLGICYIVLAYMMGWMTVPGWPSLMAALLLLFGILFAGLGIIGEYVWRTLEETRQRPSFIVESEYKPNSSETNN